MGREITNAKYGSIRGVGVLMSWGRLMAWEYGNVFVPDGRDFPSFSYMFVTRRGHSQCLFLAWFVVLWECTQGQTFTLIYHISNDKEAVMVDLLVSFNGCIHWNVSFFTAAQDWELDLFAIFLILFMLCRLVLRWWIDWFGFLVVIQNPWYAPTIRPFLCILSVYLGYAFYD